MHEAAYLLLDLHEFHPKLFQIATRAENQLGIIFPLLLMVFRDKRRDQEEKICFDKHKSPQISTQLTPNIAKLQAVLASN